MAFLIPSHIQKRLLRYALSQLELIDTDDLPLDQLDIAWGMRSSVELRDVGVKVHVSIDMYPLLFYNNLSNRTWQNFVTFRRI
jgi:hypothetical protein